MHEIGGVPPTFFRKNIKTKRLDCNFLQEYQSKRFTPFRKNFQLPLRKNLLPNSPRPLLVARFSVPQRAGRNCFSSILAAGSTAHCGKRAREEGFFHHQRAQQRRALGTPASLRSRADQKAVRNKKRGHSLRMTPFNRSPHFLFVIPRSPLWATRNLRFSRRKSRSLVRLRRTRDDTKILYRPAGAFLAPRGARPSSARLSFQ